MPPGGRQRQMSRGGRKGRRVAPGRARAVLGGLVASAGRSAPARWWSGLSRRGRRLAAGAAALLVAGAVVVIVVMAGQGAPPLRERQYLAFTACLLTDGRGVSGPPASQAWAGMRDASLATHAMAEYLPVMTGSTEGAAAPVLASLLARQCRVVVAAGQAQTEAVLADARRYPSVRFAVIDSGSEGKITSGPNVVVISGGGTAVRSAVAKLVTSAVAASS